jgi:hypothetical protein
MKESVSLPRKFWIVFQAGLKMFKLPDCGHCSNSLMIVRQNPFFCHSVVYLSCCQGTFRERVHVTVSKTVPKIISSLLASDSEDIRLSVIGIISDLVAKGSIMDPSSYLHLISAPSGISSNHRRYDGRHSQTLGKQHR